MNERPTGVNHRCVADADGNFAITFNGHPFGDHFWTFLQHRDLEGRNAMRWIVISLRVTNGISVYAASLKFYPPQSERTPSPHPRVSGSELLLCVPIEPLFTSYCCRGQMVDMRLVRPCMFMYVYTGVEQNISSRDGTPSLAMCNLFSRHWWS